MQSDTFMTDLKLSFDSETIYKLTNEQFKQLAQTGETITDFAPAKDYWIDEEFSRLFLSFDGSLSDYFFEFMEHEDIDIFIKNSYLTHFFPKTGKIKLIKDFDETLADLLPKKHFDFNCLSLMDKFKFTEQQTTFLDPLNESSVEIFTRTGNFKGQVSCCECGEAGCSSEYLWADNYIGLASFHMLAGQLQVVHLYPFKFA